MHDTQQQVRRALSDELDRYGVTDDCLALRTEDRARLGFSLKDGSERACDAPTRRRPHIEDTTTCGIISTLRRGANFELDGVSFNLSARRPGTAFLQASAKRGREELWDVPLRLVPVSGEAIGCFVGAATPGVFMVFGAPRGDDHAITAVGLNAESGTERYASDIGGTYGQVNEIHYNGRFVVLGLLRRALALDPATGQTAGNSAAEPSTVDATARKPSKVRDPSWNSSKNSGRHCTCFRELKTVPSKRGTSPTSSTNRIRRWST